MAKRYDLDDIFRGDTIPFSFKWTSSGLPIDMRGREVIVTLKTHQHQPDEDAVLTKSVTYAFDDAEAENGITTIAIAASESATLKAPMRYHWALRVIDGTGSARTETTYLYGTVKVEDA